MFRNICWAFSGDNVLSKENINVDMIVQSGSAKDANVTYAFTISKT